MGRLLSFVHQLAANNAINSDEQKRHFALLLQAGYD
jgi:hypothetical protein